MEQDLTAGDPTWRVYKTKNREARDRFSRSRLSDQPQNLAPVERKVDADGIRESARSVQRLLDAEIAAGIDSRRVVLAGFSQGGAIALHLGLRYAHTLGGILALSTYLPLADSLADAAASAQQATPILVLHGTRDPLVPEKLGNHAAETLRTAGYDVTYQTYPMEHAVSAAEIADIATWLKARLA